MNLTCNICGCQHPQGEQCPAGDESTMGKDLKIELRKFTKEETNALDKRAPTFTADDKAWQYIRELEAENSNLKKDSDQNSSVINFAQNEISKFKKELEYQKGTYENRIGEFEIEIERLLVLQEVNKKDWAKDKQKISKLKEEVEERGKRINHLDERLSCLCGNAYLDEACDCFGSALGIANAVSNWTTEGVDNVKKETLKWVNHKDKQIANLHKIISVCKGALGESKLCLEYVRKHMMRNSGFDLQLLEAIGLTEQALSEVSKLEKEKT